MKQFGTIYRFELIQQIKNKIFVGITLLVVVLLAGVMFFPRISDSVGEADTVETEKPSMLVMADTPENASAISEVFAEVFVDYRVVPFHESIDNAKEKIVSGEVECVFEFKTLTEYTYYVNNLSMYDVNSSIADEAIKSLYQLNTMVSLGMTPEEAQMAMNAPVESHVESLGKDQVQNFFYTYVMIFGLYMVMLLYGQMVANNVATEKSSRAMEVLITSAKPVNMMFGKVLASCTVGFLQLTVIFGSAMAFYKMNESYWTDNEIIKMLFDIPMEMLVYMLTFFVLGFLIYAFLYGAVGSTVSKLEDITTAVMPITLIFVAGFMVVMMAMTSGDVDTPLMVACSFIPFTSPMAMFTRIALSTVAPHEIAISIGILAASVVGVGVLSAKIYRVGVLLYGNAPKIGAILKTIRKS